MRSPSHSRRQGAALIAAGVALPIILWLFASWLFGGWIAPYPGNRFIAVLCPLAVIGPIVTFVGLVMLLTSPGAPSEGADDERR